MLKQAMAAAGLLLEDGTRHFSVLGRLAYRREGSVARVKENIRQVDAVNGGKRAKNEAINLSRVPSVRCSAYLCHVGVADTYHPIRPVDMGDQRTAQLVVLRELAHSPVIEIDRRSAKYLAYDPHTFAEIE
ncbi:hypothetical protein P3W24_04070 [Luteibacter sp. PPL201]|uniref:Uncharacterized protein n=1 Tax=Luteibacter sahnii TaxID=3021977 RepID=A0ABT6BA38_9GAMM|nr:hypothetical protein [Luteibacter sp. PPL193]MDY1547952.1 hypothetical protein [Luteibacter sp. PPL193]